MDEQTRAIFLRWRGVEDPCPTCGGSGVRLYPNTSGWRMAAGGSVSTRDVCDRCWGTGDVHRIGVDLRRMAAEEEERVTERAVGLLAERAGAGLKTGREALLVLVGELERMAGQPRKHRPNWFRETCEALAKTLREGMGA